MSGHLVVADDSTSEELLWGGGFSRGCNGRVFYSAQFNPGIHLTVLFYQVGKKWAIFTQLVKKIS